MKFVRTISGYNHLWAVRDEGKETDELSLLFRQWSNINYLLDFFFANLNDLKSFFHVEKVSDAIKDTMDDARELERISLRKFNHMRQKTLDFLEANRSKQPSTFIEDSKRRQENEVWQKWSRGVALSVVDYMQAYDLSRSDVAERLGVSPQYVSRILSGNINFSFKSVAEIERKLGISCMETATAL